MDPQAALDACAYALAEGDAVESAEYLLNFGSWAWGGGYVNRKMRDQANELRARVVDALYKLQEEV